LKGFLDDFVEFKYNEGDNDFTKIPQYNKTERLSDNGITTETLLLYTRAPKQQHAAFGLESSG